MDKAFRVGEFTVEPELNRIRRGEATFHVEPKVLEVLVFLARHPKEVLSKERIIQAVWADTFVSDDVLTHAISQLRRAFGDDASEPRVIQTIPRKGYRLLAEVSAGEAEGSSAASGTGRHSHQNLKLVALVVVGLGVGLLLAFYLSRSSLRSPLDSPLDTSILQLTSYPGFEVQPAFSPDGRRIAFSWNGGLTNDYDIYVQSIGDVQSTQLTSGPENDFGPVWSPDGQRIAFVRQSGVQTAIFSVPSVGGNPESLLVLDWKSGKTGSHQPGLSWSPNGRLIAFSDKDSAEAPFSIHLLTERSEKKRLTFPPDDIHGDFTPRFSPDGSRVAFRRMRALAVTGVYLISVGGGEPEVIPGSEDHAMGSHWTGLTWTPSGRGIIFSSFRGGTANLWRVSTAGGTPRKLPFGSRAVHPVISPAGDRLVYSKRELDSDLWRLEVRRSDEDSELSPVSLVNSTAWDTAPQISPQGDRIVFASNRRGKSFQIWTCDSGGSDQRQLTDISGGSPRWAPDGKRIAFVCWAEGPPDICVINPEMGSSLRLTGSPSADVLPSWSRDGNWVYFGSDRSGDWQIWRIAAGGGEPVQVSSSGGFEAFESTDGHFFYFTKPSVAGIWKIPVSGGEEKLVLKNARTKTWALAEDGIFFLTEVQADGAVLIKFLNFATQRVRRIASVKEEIDFDLPSLTASPKGEWLVIAGGRFGADLMLVENLQATLEEH